MNLEQWQQRFAGDPEVLKVEMAPTGFGNGTYLKRAVRITMAGGTTAAGCVWDGCSHVASHPTGIVTKHWRSHTGEATPQKRAAATGTRKVNEYSHLSFSEIAVALSQADAKVRRAEAARDKALEQVANMREVNRDVVTNLRAQLEEAQAELARVRDAVKVLYPGALG
jgi:hypothetical protein